MLKASLDHAYRTLAFSLSLTHEQGRPVWGLFTAGVKTAWLRTVILEDKSHVIQCSWTHNWNPERLFDGGVTQEGGENASVFVSVHLNPEVIGQQLVWE